MIQTVALLLIGSLALLPIDDHAGVVKEPLPLAVWIAGSHAASPEVALTRSLRDALEANILVHNPDLTPEQAAESRVVIYLPEIVTLSGDRQTFRYSAMLADREFRPLVKVAGKCRSNDVVSCARDIYQRLTLNN